MEDLREVILRLLGERAPEASICPSEVARAAGGAQWRALMAPVREAAADLVDGGRIAVTQGASSVDIRTVRGPVRLRAARPAGRAGPEGELDQAPRSDSGAEPSSGASMLRTKGRKPTRS